MSTQKSSIEWTDRTWNPVKGCSLASPGCTHCYAMRQAHRFSGKGGVFEGLTRTREHGGPVWTGEVRRASRATLHEPLRWRTPARVFVNSMSDLFHENLPDDAIDEVFAVMLACELFESLTAHTFQILTKRAERMARYFEAGAAALLRRWGQAGDGWAIVGDGDSEGFSESIERRVSHRTDDAGRIVESNPWGFCDRLFPLPRVHLGVSVENQHYAEQRVPLLLQTPAAARFLSLEPLLDDVNLGALRDGSWYDREGADFYDALRGRAYWGQGDAGLGGGPRVDQVIVGGESGPGARFCEIEAVRRVVAQCRDAGVACFVKQLGAVPVVNAEPTGNFRTHPSTGRRQYEMRVTRLNLRDPKGGDMSEWPEDLQVREEPALTPVQPLFGRWIKKGTTP